MNLFKMRILILTSELATILSRISELMNWALLMINHLLSVHLRRSSERCEKKFAFCMSSGLGRPLKAKEVPELVHQSERGDVPGWVLVVLMTAGLVTGIWTVAAPRLNQILRSSLDSMNVIR